MKIDTPVHFDKEGYSGDFYVSSDDKRGFSAVRVFAHGKFPRKKMIGTTRIYFVIDGEGTFTINDDTYTAKKNDLYIIDPGSEYEYEGNMALFEFNVSPDNSFKAELV